jgi:proline dehydrogenase
MSDFKLNFHDTATAFADKSNAELKQKYWLFKMMNSPWLVDFGTASTEFALSLGLPVQGMIKSTVFKQFCGGETIEE